MSGFIVTSTLNGSTEVISSLVLEREQAEHIRDLYLLNNPHMVIATLRVHKIDIDGACNGCPVLERYHQIHRLLLEEDGAYDIPE